MHRLVDEPADTSRVAVRYQGARRDRPHWQHRRLPAQMPVTPAGCPVEIGKAGVQTAAGSLSRRDLGMPGQRPVVYRLWAGGFGVRCLLAWCLRRFCRALADGGRSCRTRGPAFGARPCVLAVPAQVGAVAAAVGHHLVSRQADAAHPAGFGVGLFCPVAGPSAVGQLWPARLEGSRHGRWSRRAGAGTFIGAAGASNGGCSRPPARSASGSSGRSPISDVPASYGQPVFMCTPSPSVRGHLVYPGACARRRACRPPYRGRAHPSVSFQISPSRSLHYSRIDFR